MPVGGAGLTGAAEGGHALRPRSYGPPGRTPGVPTDQELEAAGAVIGKVVIDNQNIFDLDNPKDNTKLFRLADRLHPVTRASVIRRQLLFKTGERFSHRLIEESERILRGDNYFYDAWIRAIDYKDGKVDLRVTTRDVWTLNPGFNFGRSGGKNSVGVQLEEINLAGTGTDLKLSHSSDVDRTSNQVEVRSNHAFGSWVAYDANYANLSDGRLRELTVQQPFYSLETRWALGGYVIADEQTDSLWDRSQVIDKFQDQHNGASLFGGWSTGLRNGWVQRVSTGLTYDEHRFAPVSTWTGVPLVPEDRRFAYPWVQYDLIQDDYLKLFNHDQIARTEDFYIGTSASVRVGWAQRAFGSSSDAAIFQGSASRGFLEGGSTLLLATDFAGRTPAARYRTPSSMPRCATTSSRARTGCSSPPCPAPRAGTWTSMTRSCSAATMACAATRCATRTARHGRCSRSSSAISPTGIRSACSGSEARSSSMPGASGARCRSRSPTWDCSRMPGSDCASATRAQRSATWCTWTSPSPSGATRPSSACSC